jgi:hypothetical protein
MTLHNFIRDSALDDKLFAQCDVNEDFILALMKQQPFNHM